MMNKMKGLLKIIVVAVFCLSSPVTSWCQYQTQKAVEDAIKSGRFELEKTWEQYANEHPLGRTFSLRDVENRRNNYEKSFVKGAALFTVASCDIDINDFNAFFNRNNQYILQGKNTRTETKYRKEFTYVTSFSFSNNKDVLSRLEICVRSANKNLNLQLPSVQNFNEISAFYQKHVGPFPKVVEVFKEEFAPKCCEWYCNHPEAVKQLCEGSPYPNADFVKALGVWQILCQYSKNCVFLIDANRGYIFDNNGRYDGQIRNGKAEGQGTRYEGQKKWEGTFKNGKKAGSFTCSSRGEYYTDDYYGNGLCISGCPCYTFISTGNCVDDQWDGEVKTVVTCSTRGESNTIKHQYSNGQLVKRVIEWDNLTRAEEYDRWKKEERKKREKIEKERREAERRLELSSVNVNNIMNYVKNVSFKENNHYRTEYEVVFTDGKSGEIAFIKKEAGIFLDIDADSWAWYCSGFLSSGYEYAEFNKLPNTKEGALVGLFHHLHPY